MIASTATTPAAFAVPQVSFSSAPALEVRDLCGGREVRPQEFLDDLATLGPDWRLETANELRALYVADHVNQHGARTRDESLHPVAYWTADLHPVAPSARVVVWFDDGLVNVSYFDFNRARARAVRVAGQSSAL